MPSAVLQRDLGRAIAKLTSLHDGDAGVTETVACGPAAIPALRAILFSRQPSGLYETRRRAVEALQDLQALDVLREFLATPRDITDPVERTGEDAVINAAARAVGKAGNTRDIALFFVLIETHAWSGVIEALGRFRQIAALPYFIEALGDDFTRPAAEAAIRKLGAKALDTLVAAAQRPSPPAGRETGSSINRRRSALTLLQTIAIPPAVLSASVAQLIQDADPWIAFRAARLCLSRRSNTDKTAAVERLLALLKSADELLAEEIEDCFVDHYALVREILRAVRYASQSCDDVPAWRSRDRTRQVLARVKRRMSQPSKQRGCA
jgi:hypothetical protein